MSSELERRLDAMLAAAPEPDPGAGEEALHRALRACSAVAAPRRGLRAAVLVFAAVVVLLVIAAGSLAGAGALHVSFGTKPEQVPVTKRAPASKGGRRDRGHRLRPALGATKSGFDLQGLPVTAATLSPHGLYVAAGIGRASSRWPRPPRLVPTAGAGCPRQTTSAARSRRSRGHRTVFAWPTSSAPTRVESVLHIIWGNGTHDTVIDRNAQGVTPSWRADSLAVAYVGSGGRPVVYDLGHVSHR